MLSYKNGMYSMLLGKTSILSLYSVANSSVSQTG
jgi:hypothetical protein